MAAIDSAASVPNGVVQPLPQGTFADAFRIYMADFFNSMEANLQTYLEANIPPVHLYWVSQAPTQSFTSDQINQVSDALALKMADLTTDVVFQTGWIQ